MTNHAETRSPQDTLAQIEDEVVAESEFKQEVVALADESVHEMLVFQS